MISNNLQNLRSEIIIFIQDECNIPLDLHHRPISATIYFNDSFNKWQLTLEDSEKNRAYLRFKDIDTLDKILEKAKEYIKVKSWNHTRSNRGLEIWEGIL